MLKDLLKPLKQLKLMHLGVLQNLPAPPPMDDRDIVILWVDDAIARNKCSPVYSAPWISRRRSIILVGNRIEASNAFLLGAAGYTRMFSIPSEKDSLLDEILGRIQMYATRSPAEAELPDLDSVLIGSSIPVTALKNLIRKIAPRDKLMVLIRGETGTGKGLVAKMLHQLSPRADKPFIEINCTAIPDSLVEAELFGHEKGAFTDAHKNRRGIFELANGGTLFLDEIGYLRPDIQVKLLKILEDRRFRRIGGEKDIQVDCRIITGTSVNLEDKITRGEFREDLFYRLNVFPIVVPPLRERGQDVVRLAEHFRDFYSREHAIQSKGFTEKAIQCMIRGSWHGNIRELKHCIERAVILSENQLITEEVFACETDTELLPETNSLSSGVPPENDGFLITVHIPEPGKSMDQIQRDVIESVLERTSGNRSEAARLLRISRSRLLRRINPEHDGE